MAIPKVLGIETEYGIHTPGPDPNPIIASSYLVNSYAIALDQRTGWDFEDEAPGRDARGSSRPGSMPPIVETHLANTVLINGARFYVDHAHPEYSSPECKNPRDLLLYDLAGEEVLRRAMAAATRLFPDVPPSVVYKNNSDGKGNSYGCHENYLIDRVTPFPVVATGIIPHLLTRSLFAGAGKVGIETNTFEKGSVEFQLTQRAEFFEEVMGLETTIKRPLINTRDEPHADPQRYRRLHVIIGDANRSETATFLKVGTTALILAMIEDNQMPTREFVFDDPVDAFHRISADISMSVPLELNDGSTITAMAIQWELLDAAQIWCKKGGVDALGNAEMWEQVLETWEQVLSDLERGPHAVADRVDWAAKITLMEAYRERHGCAWNDPRLRAMDLQYHDLRPQRSLFDRLPMVRLVDPDAIANAITAAPSDTRAWFRGQCLSRWPDAIMSANWDSIVLDVGDESLQRIPMMDPLNGTRAQMATLLEGCKSPRELIKLLSE